jgi:hypothetical protein
MRHWVKFYTTLSDRLLFAGGDRVDEQSWAIQKKTVPEMNSQGTANF